MMHPDPLRRTVNATPAAPALVDAEGEWSYRALDAAADRLAGRLAAAGVGPGDRVALLLAPGPVAVLAIHAVPRTGAILAPLNVKWSAPERERALDALAPALILVTPESGSVGGAPSAVPRLGLFRDDLGPATPGPGTGPPDAPSGAPAYAPVDDPAAVSADAAGSSSGGDPPAHADERPAPVAPDDTLAILWTSGTSGSPRGIELTRRNLEASAEAARVHLDLRASDAWYAALNPAHIGGLALVVRAAVVGCRVFVEDGFHPARLNRRIDAGDVTHASLVPTMLDQLLESRGAVPAPATLRCILLGGAAAPVALVRRAVALGFPVAVTYGLTEASSQVVTAPPDLVRRALAGAPPALPAAPPLPGVSLLIAEDGEILVKGDTVARRTFNAPGLRMSDGWLHTGDLGRLDAAGHLRVTGRMSDRIISGGVNIDPSEVEEVVRAHPSVLDAVVLGLPDPRWGERVGAAVVPVPGRNLAVEELLDFSRSRLSAAKRPRALVLLDAIPRNANGKVDRERLRGLDWPDPDPSSNRRRGS